MVGLTCNEEPLSVCYIPALARPRLFTKHHQRGKPTSHLEPVWAPRSLIVVFDFASCPPAGVMSYNSAAFYCAVYVMTHRLRGAPSPPPSGPLRLLLRGPFSSQCMVTSLRRPPTSGLVSPALSAAAPPSSMPIRVYSAASPLCLIATSRSTLLLTPFTRTTPDDPATIRPLCLSFLFAVPPATSLFLRPTMCWPLPAPPHFHPFRCPSCPLPTLLW